jgi:AcrR family transcriptional regulator
VLTSDTDNRTSIDEEPAQAPPDERRLREERILDTAAALMVRWGYRKTTIDDVAREAGVGKGTIYLHWKDKSQLFSAAIWRASRQVSEDMMRRVAADPEGGLFHRVWTHGMLSTFSNPLMTALMQGRPDIFQGLLDTLDKKVLNQIVLNAETHIVQLQQAGLIRTDLAVPVMTYLIGALKTGIINVAELTDQQRMPSIEQLTEALSDLMRRWLEPEQLPADSAVGKQIMAEWLDRVNDISEQSRGQQGTR